MYNTIENRKPLVCIPSSYAGVTEEKLITCGFNIVIYANHLIRAIYPAMVEVAESILRNRSAKEASEKYCMPIKEILTLISPGKIANLYSIHTSNQ